jgi:hypothetical protein
MQGCTRMDVDEDLAVDFIHFSRKLQSIPVITEGIPVIEDWFNKMCRIFKVEPDYRAT